MRKPDLVLFYTGAGHGTLEPCGCTSDPLGDVSRVAGAIRQTDTQIPGAVLWLDAGNLTFPAEPLEGGMAEAAALRARFLAEATTQLPFVGAALGQSDLAQGWDGVMPARLAANVRMAAGSGKTSSHRALRPSQLKQLGGVTVGIMGLTGMPGSDGTGETSLPTGVLIDPPVETARAESRKLRQQGADLVIALAAMPRRAARRVARASDIDIVVVGEALGPEGMASAEPAGRGFLVGPGDEFQRLGRLDIFIDNKTTFKQGDGPRLVDAGGPESRARRIKELRTALDQADKRMAPWLKEAKNAGNGDNTNPNPFLQKRLAQREALAKELANMTRTPWTPPTSGSYFVNRLIKVNKSLPKDPGLDDAMNRLDIAIGAVNKKNATPPPPAEDGRAVYLGALRAPVVITKPPLFGTKRRTPGPGKP